MSNVVQWTLDQLYKQLATVSSKAEAERAQISMSNAALMALDKRANGITDATRKAAVKAAIKASVARQAEIVKGYRTFSAKFAQAADSARAWMKAQGYTPPAGLAGLGVVQVIVPVAIAGAVAVALTAVAWLHEQNSVQKKALSLHSQLIDGYLKGQITSEQYAAAAAQLEAEAKAAAPKTDPFGLASLSGALVPLGVIAALIVLGPSVLRALQSRRLVGARA